MNLRRAAVAALAFCAALALAVLLAMTGGGTSHTRAGTTIITPSKDNGRPGMVIVGASYSAALGATSPRFGYAELLGRQLGWRVAVSAVPGSGYLNPGPRHEGTFLQRLDRIHGLRRPRIVLIQGGRNDAGSPPARLGAAVCATVDGARQRFAGSHVVLLGDVPIRVPVPAAQLRVATVLADAAHRCRAAFLDPIGEHWITAHNERRFRGPVRDHPGNAGYAYIAHRVETDLRGLGLVGDPTT